jgi:hypothetical protein
VFEWFDPDLTREYANADYTGDDQAEDWVHLNSVHYDEVEDVFYVTSRFQNALFKIDHQTGDLLWTLGGAWSDFAMEQEQILIEPHSSQPIKDGFTFFEYLDHQSADCSAATDIAVDEGAMTVSQTWQYATETCTYNAYFGNSQALANGNRLLVLSHLAKIDEVVPATNDIVHRMTLPLNSTFGFAERFESLYP